MNKLDMELIKNMNEYIKKRENENEVVNHDASDALGYLTELLPKLKNITWSEVDRLRTLKAIDECVNSNPSFDDVKYYKNLSTSISDFKKVNEGVKYIDYSKNINILYSQMCLVIQKICSILMSNGQMSRDEWEDITRTIVKAYNYAAEGTDYYMDVNNEK